MKVELCLGGSLSVNFLPPLPRTRSPPKTQAHRHLWVMVAQGSNTYAGCPRPHHLWAASLAVRAPTGQLWRGWRSVRGDAGVADMVLLLPHTLGCLAVETCT